MPAILKLMKSKAKQESQIGYFRIDQLVLNDWETRLNVNLKKGGKQYSKLSFKDVLFAKTSSNYKRAYLFN